MNNTARERTSSSIEETSSSANATIEIRGLTKHYEQRSFLQVVYKKMHSDYMVHVDKFITVDTYMQLPTNGTHCY